MKNLAEKQQDIGSVVFIYFLICFCDNTISLLVPGRLTFYTKKYLDNYLFVIYFIIFIIRFINILYLFSHNGKQYLKTKIVIILCCIYILIVIICNIVTFLNLDLQFLYTFYNDFDKPNYVCNNTIINCKENVNNHYKYLIIKQIIFLFCEILLYVIPFLYNKVNKINFYNVYYSVKNKLNKNSVNDINPILP